MRLLSRLLVAHLATFLALDPTTGELFPWSNAPLKPLHALASHGCPWNHTFTVDWTYRDWARATRSSLAYRRGLISRRAVVALAAPRQVFNPHLSLCPFAVLLALQLWQLHRMLEAIGLTGNRLAWDRAWSDVLETQRLWKVIRAELLLPVSAELSCQATLRHGLAHFGGYKAAWWPQALIQGRGGSLLGMQAPLPTHSEPVVQLFDQRVNDLTSPKDRIHLRMLQAGKEIMEGAKAAGLLQHWTIAFGTLVSALRYGDSFGPRLPSGYQEDFGATDMDIYLVTDRWPMLYHFVVNHGLSLGFSWCGKPHSWHPQSMCCISEGEEIEIHNIDKRSSAEVNATGPHPVLAQMLPLTRCAAARDDSAPNGVLTVPCPRSPIDFMKYYWPHRPEYTSCFALPTDRHNVFQPLSENDLRFIWGRGLELQSIGLQSMVPYFAECDQHPNADFARSLAWDVQLLMRNHKLDRVHS